MSEVIEVKKKVDGRKLGSSSRNLAKARKAKLEQLAKIREMKGIKLKTKQEEKKNTEEEYEISEDSSSSSESSESEEEQTPEQMLTRSIAMPKPSKPPKEADDKYEKLYKMMLKMNKKKPKKRAKRKTVVKIINNKAPAQPVKPANTELKKELLRF